MSRDTTEWRTRLDYTLALMDFASRVDGILAAAPGCPPDVTTVLTAERALAMIREARAKLECPKAAYLGAADV